MFRSLSPAPAIALFAAISLGSAGAYAADVTVDVTAFHRSADPVTVEVALEGEESLSADVESPGEVVFADLAEGTWTVQASAAGFDAVSTDINISGDRNVPVALYPAADVMLAGIVTRAGAPLAATTVTLEGERISGPVLATTAADGTFVVGPVPAGYYDVEVKPDDGPVTRRPSIDLLADAEMNFAVPDPDEVADVREFRRPFCAQGSGAPSGGFLLALVALIGVRRR